MNEDKYFLAVVTDSIDTVTYELVKAKDWNEAHDKVWRAFGYGYAITIKDTIE